MNMHRSGANAEPDFAMALSKIQHMSKEELNDLLNNEAKLEEYVKSLDQVSKISAYGSFLLKYDQIF